MALDTGITIYDPIIPVRDQLHNEQKYPIFDYTNNGDPLLGQFLRYKYKFTYDPIHTSDAIYKISCVVSYALNLQSDEEKIAPTEISRKYKIELEYIEMPESIIDEDALTSYFDNLEQVAKFLNNC